MEVIEEMSGMETLKPTLPQVLCCICGVSMQPNAANTCSACLQTEHNITEQILKELILLRCRSCERFQKETTGWSSHSIGLESKELLALCIRKAKGLQTLKLLEAKFLFTEPHSKRLKIEVAVSKEVIPNVLLKQQCVITYIIKNRMCEDCHKFEAKNTWNSLVQVRQKVKHKRTFLFLEQLIIKYRQYEKTVKIGSSAYGMDFFFAQKNDAVSFLDFLDSVVPIKKKSAKKIITADLKSNLTTFHHTFCADITPVCKDDFAILPRKLSQKQGNISQFLLCSNVSNRLKFIDPRTCQICSVTAEAYWKSPFQSVVNTRDLIEFIVLDIESIDYLNHANSSKTQKGNAAFVKLQQTKKRKQRNQTGVGKVPVVHYKDRVLYDKFNSDRATNKFKLVQVEVVRASDFGVNDTKYVVNSHLGRILKVGDSVLGYDLTRKNLNIDENDPDFSHIKQEDLPEIVLVKKHYPLYRRRLRQQKRNWKLKKLAMDVIEAEDEKSNQKSGNATLPQDDEELFMRDVEENVELRSNMNLYKNEACATATTGEDTEGTDAEGVEDDAPIIGVEQLLNDLELS